MLIVLLPNRKWHSSGGCGLGAQLPATRLTFRTTGKLWAVEMHEESLPHWCAELLAAGQAKVWQNGSCLWGEQPQHWWRQVASRCLQPLCLHVAIFFLKSSTGCAVCILIQNEVRISWKEFDPFEDSINESTCILLLKCLLITGDGVVQEVAGRPSKIAHCHIQLCSTFHLPAWTWEAGEQGGVKRTRSNTTRWLILILNNSFTEQGQGKRNTDKKQHFHFLFTFSLVSCMILL